MSDKTVRESDKTVREPEMHSVDAPMQATDATVLIMAGGTGGHVFPALAAADVLLRSGVRVQWLGTARGIEADLVPKEKVCAHNSLRHFVSRAHCGRRCNC
jgi:hypothetical protein